MKNFLRHVGYWVVFLVMLWAVVCLAWYAKPIVTSLWHNDECTTFDPSGPACERTP